MSVSYKRHNRWCRQELQHPNNVFHYEIIIFSIHYSNTSNLITIAYLDKNEMTNLKEQSFDKRNKLEKEKYFTYEKVGKYQLIKQVRVENLLEEHTTEVMFSDMVINTGMSDKLFQEISLRRLPLD